MRSMMKTDSLVVQKLFLLIHGILQLSPLEQAMFAVISGALSVILL